MAKIYLLTEPKMEEMIHLLCVTSKASKEFETRQNMSRCVNLLAQLEHVNIDNPNKLRNQMKES